MKERIAIVAGLRTPFCKAGGIFKDYEADDLGAYVVRELIARSGIPCDQFDELIFGNVLQPPHAFNIARVIAVKAGLCVKVPAYTVNRNCASGMESLISSADKIHLGRDNIVIAGGVESMSNFPVMVKKKYKEFLARLGKAKNLPQKLGALAAFRPSFLLPDAPEIADPLCGLNMGQTAELLVRDFKISRDEQDQFALASQQRAHQATTNGYFTNEIVPVPVPPAYSTMQLIDDGVRSDQTIEALAKLKPSFEKITGTVTPGTSSQITDGAAATILMKESKAKAMGLKPLGYIRDYAEAGLQPSRMGLGPVYATSKLLKRTGQKLSDFDLIEINEAFAAQVLGCVKAFASDEFAKKELERDVALGEIDREKLNVNGGALALGHPLGASGTRLIITILNELRRRKKNLGLATLCIGGGQGQAIILEVE